MTICEGKEKEVLAMENGGNNKVNAIFEANLNTSKPTTSASGPVRERFIRDKYERRKYYNPAMLQQFQASEDSSSEEDSSEDEQTKRRSTVRAPSEAARLRAQARQQRMGGTSAPPSKSKSSASPGKQSRAVKNRIAAKASAPAEPVGDLLDFGFSTAVADPGPPPNPPSASPSPTLDLFKNMNVSNEPTAPPETQNTNSLSAHNQKSSIDDILGLFNAPMNNNNMGFNNPGMNNGMVANNNQMGAMNMNPMMYNQQTQNINTNFFTNSSNNNMMMNNKNNQMQQMQMPHNNLNFFNGMQNNMNNNMNGGQMQMQQSNVQQSNNMGMSMQQNQQQAFGMAPMGGTPSNLTVMGGEGMNQHSMFAHEQKHNSAFGFMEESSSASSNNGPGVNPQMNQFASFGSFR